MQSLVQWLLNILNLFKLIGVDNIITLALTIFALALGLLAINHLRRRTRTTDLQRTAAIIKGLHFAGIAHDVLATVRTNPRDHLLRGLRWVLAGAGVSSALYGSAMLQSSPDKIEAWRGALVGIVPAAIGLAHLLFSCICSRGQQTGHSMQTGHSITYAARRR